MPFFTVGINSPLIRGNCLTVQGISCTYGVPDCGQHGTLTAPCSCVCASGWATNPNQDFSNYVYCNVTSTALNASLNLSPGEIACVSSCTKSQGCACKCTAVDISPPA